MGSCQIIGICGGSGSGKTSFIRKLRTIFSESDLCIVSQDDYYFPREQQKKDERGIKNFDLPGSINNKELVRDLELLRKGNLVQRKEYTFNNAQAEPKIITFKPAPIIIVEGLFVFHNKEIWDRLDYKIYISAKENLKVIRRIKRDQIERNYPLDDVLYRYENHVMGAFEQYIAPYKTKADIIVNNNTNFNKGFEILEGFIENKLMNLQKINKS